MNKIESSELESLKDIQKNLINYYLDLGQLEYSKIGIENEIKNTYEIINKIKKEEIELKNKLNSKYGDIKINIETGEFKK